VSKTKQDMLKILIEKVSELKLENSEDLVKKLLEAEVEAANTDDRRPVQRRMTSLIDDALRSEKEG
jgi:hypothetical protein